MKKLLLGTTALIGAATVLANVALADDPKVTVGGFNNFEAAFVKDDFDSSERNRSFRNDTEIHFNIAGKSDMGLGYGAEIDLQADVDGNPASGSAGAAGANPGNTGRGIVANRTYAWLEGDKWGHLEYGSNDGVARTMKVDAANIARATGGIDGDWSLFADANNQVATIAGPVNIGGSNAAFGSFGGFITAPRLPVEHGPVGYYASDVWGNDTKITYYTPRAYGLQLGVSYAPDLYSRGEVTNRYIVGNDLGDVFEGGVNYEAQFDQIGFAAAATGEIGHSDDNNIKDLRAWNAGAKLSLAGFSVAGSYGDWIHSLAVEGTGTTADYWTAGVAYEAGPLGASVTYLGSRTQPTGFDNRFDDISVGLDYKLAPGLTPFAEYTYFSARPSQDGNSNGLDNRGNVVIVGSQLSF